MVIISISLDPVLLESFDNFIGDKGYNNRSEAFREMIRTSIDEWQMSKAKSRNIAAIMVVSEKQRTRTGLAKIQHKYTEIQTLLHTHLDSSNCLEIYIVKGQSSKLDKMIKELRQVSGVKKVEFFTSVADG